MIYLNQLSGFLVIALRASSHSFLTRPHLESKPDMELSSLCCSDDRAASRHILEQNTSWKESFDQFTPMRTVAIFFGKLLWCSRDSETWSALPGSTGSIGALARPLPEPRSVDLPPEVERCCTVNITSAFVKLDWEMDNTGVLPQVNTEDPKREPINYFGLLPTAVPRHESSSWRPRGDRSSHRTGCQPPSRASRCWGSGTISWAATGATFRHLRPPE